PEQLRAEAEEEAPAVLLTISDATGKVLRTVTGPVTAGIHRVSWDLREPAPVLPKSEPKEADEDVFAQAPSGPLVMPGGYKVSLAKRVGGKVTPLGEVREFKVVMDGAETLTPAGHKALAEFQQKVVRLQRAVAGALEAANDVASRLERIKRTLDHTPSIEAKWKAVARALEQRNRDILRALRGDTALRGRNENTPLSISERVNFIVRSQRYALARPTQIQREAYEIASEEFGQELTRLRTLIETDLRRLEQALEAAGAPWTPGRLPEWKAQ
ncbi:MAG TPA: hypothetical protein VEL76_11640, partial [Gemmataceae bacterium]|nr:hypothetical protein [Gemmataceae bacterium]